jgi:hypothetical protein
VLHGFATIDDRWHDEVVRSPLRPWLLITPLSAVGMLVGHELAYAVTRTPQAGLHGYLGHLPEICLFLVLFTLVGASLVERGSRIVLWPFPAVVIAGFVVQEHVERIVHSDSVPFLLDNPVFGIGLGIQVVVAVAAWLCARLLIRVVGSTSAPRRRALRVRLVEISFAPLAPMRAIRLARGSRSRAPPFSP